MAMAGWPVLQPFRGDGITFARPAGMIRKDAPAGTYRFERELPSEDDANGFQVTYLGRIPWDKLPAPAYMIKQTLASRHLTLVGTMGTTPHLAAEAIADTGVPGPNRFVRLLQMTRWDVPSEMAVNLTWLVRGMVPASTAVISLEISAPTLEVLDRRSLGYVLSAIGWSASVISEVVPAEALVGGTWRAGSVEASTANFSATGEWQGASFPARAGGEFKFEPGNRFRLVIANAVTSRTYVMPDEYYVDGTTVATYSSGEYRYDGGVLTLTPSLCVTYLSTVTAPLRKSDCHLNRFPVALRFEQDEGGVIRVNGKSSEPLTGSQITELIARPSQPGTWNVPRPSGILLPGTPSGPINWKYNACGIEDNEPNDVKPEPYTPEQAVQGCLPAEGDADYYELFPPAGETAQGWGELSVTDVGAGTVTALISEVGSDGMVSLGEVVKSATVNAGEPKFVYWKRKAGQRYAFSIRGGNFDPFTYRAKAVLKSVEVNDEPYGGIPVRLEVGVPSTAFFYASYKGGQFGDEVDDDHYVINLKPGVVRILIEDIPSDVTLDWDLSGVGGNRVKGPVMDVTRSFSFTGPGDRMLKLLGWFQYDRGSSATGEVPESFRKPYRITVTQP
jgi:hypothetical protein